ncbi:MAG TPA: geranylgeranyl reductase family protein [Nocardioides sp.]|nr:geranylgeranyl reductase family protein [Nocardioides sp.]
MSAWDLVVVGAGPAGSAAAIGALGVDPTLRVALLDRARFPRDKSCGDGIAPQVVDLLEEAGVPSVVGDRRGVPRLRLERGALAVERGMERDTWVIPRAEFDHRLVTAACAAGAELLHERVREVHEGATLGLDDRHEARVVVGADGAHSVVRRGLGLAPGPMAVALRGYAPTPPARAGAQVIVFDTARQPAYAWSFDRGDGLSNVGYGEVAGHRPERLTKAHLLERLEALLPGATAGATAWRGHHLPLSHGRWRPQPGRVLLAGDAAGLVNPMTGEGIYYAVATGLAAGRASAEALRDGLPATAGTRYAAATGPLLDRHLRHVRLAGRLCRHGVVVDAGLRASASDQRVFDDLVELGLARGRLTPALLRGLGRELAATATHRRTHPPTTTHDEETAPCES